MKKIKWFGLIALGLTLSLSGCGIDLIRPEFSFDGTVTHLVFAKGTYGIVSDNGDNYLPINLDPSYEVGGIRVRVKARYTNTVYRSVIIQWSARDIEILEIERIE